MGTSARTEATGDTVIGSRYVTFTSVEKILSIFYAQAQAVVTLTSVGTTATATVTAHGFGTGTSVVITGAVQTPYNGNYVITVTGINTFTYTFAGSGTSPATGTIRVSLANPLYILGEKSFDELRNQVTGVQPPLEYAISTQDATSVTVFMDCVATSVITLTADVYKRIVDLSGTDLPLFSENYHDILIYAGKIPELKKMEKPDLAKTAEDDYDRRLSQLRMYIAMSAYKNIFQGKTSGWNVSRLTPMA